MLLENKRILICPLDWGLGHATRIVPIINKLKLNNTIIIAADNAPLKLLTQEFPSLDYIKFPSVEIKYPKDNSMVFKMILQSKKILKSIKDEHITIAKIIKDKNIDVVISDNRYGAWSIKTYNIFITHQLMLKMPTFLKILEKPTHNILLRYVTKFDECWVPDNNDENNFTGDLAHKYPLMPNTKFIGILSSFEKLKKIDSKKKYEICIVLSGQEPQRSIFERIILEQIKKTNHKIVLIRGLFAEEDKKEEINNITTYSHLDRQSLLEIINESEIVISRSGYSSIMDWLKIEKPAILIPTPGQTEQEYLAKHLAKHKNFIFTSQKHFDLDKSLTELKDKLKS